MRSRALSVTSVCSLFRRPRVESQVGELAAFQAAAIGSRHVTLETFSN
jgi:hypothetical protein